MASLVSTSMLLRLLRGRGVSLAPQCLLSQSGRVFDNSSSHGASLVQFSSKAVTSPQDEEEKDAQRKLDDKRVRDRREWKRQLSELRKQFADDWYVFFFFFFFFNFLL